MSNSELQQLDQNIKASQKVVDLGNALERLKKNRDFKEVVIQGYFEKEAVRLVHLKSDPNMQSPDSQKSIVSQIDAIGALSQYFLTLEVQAHMARRALDADEATREEILAEIE